MTEQEYMDVCDLLTLREIALMFTYLNCYEHSLNKKKRDLYVKINSMIEILEPIVYNHVHPDED